MSSVFCVSFFLSLSWNSYLYLLRHFNVSACTSLYLYFTNSFCFHGNLFLLSPSVLALCLHSAFTFLYLNFINSFCFRVYLFLLSHSVFTLYLSMHCASNPVNVFCNIHIFLSLLQSFSCSTSLYAICSTSLYLLSFLIKWLSQFYDDLFFYFPIFRCKSFFILKTDVLPNWPQTIAQMHT